MTNENEIIANINIEYINYEESTNVKLIKQIIKQYKCLVCPQDIDYYMTNENSVNEYRITWEYKHSSTNFYS